MTRQSFHPVLVLWFPYLLLFNRYFLQYLPLQDRVADAPPPWIDVEPRVYGDPCLHGNKEFGALLLLLFPLVPHMDPIKIGRSQRT